MVPDCPTLEALAQSFQRAAQTFAASITSDDLAALRAARLRVCSELGARSAAELEQSGPILHDLFAQRRAVGLTSFQRTPEDDEAFARHLAAAHGGSIGHLFAALLLSWHACEVGEIDATIALPPGLRPIWATLAFEMPDLMANDADADVLAAFLTALCQKLYGIIRGPRAAADDLIDAFMSGTAFLQCYFSETNLRPLMHARAGILEDLSARIGVGVDQCLPRVPLRDRMRIGFVTMGPTDSPEGAYLSAHMKHLDRTRCEVLLFSATARSGILGQACASACDRVVDLPEQVDAAIAQIRSFDLDIAVVVNNVTASVHVATILAAHRLARIQISNLASPVTTGLRNVDFMLTGQFNEPEDAANHYTERLIYLPGSTNCYDLAPLAGGESTPVSRAAHGIPADAVLFYSSATFYKLRPRVLSAWVEILRRVPNSYLMLMPFGSKWGGMHPAAALSDMLRQRCAQAGISPGRIVVAPAVPTMADLQATMRLADVFLDTFPFSAATSMYDALCAGLPYVARTGLYSRGLHSAAILEEAGLFDWIATSDDDYIARAATLGMSPARRAAAKARMQALLAEGPPITDLAAFGAKLTVGLEALREDWNARVTQTRALPLHVIADRIAALSLKAAARLGFWGDLDMMQVIVAGYLRAGGPGTLLDVGACMGTMSAPLLQEGWRAVMFEPDPRCHEQIARLTAAFPEHARLEKSAVSTDGRKSVTFHLANTPGLSGLSQSPFQGDAATIEVPAIALSAYVAREGLQDVGFIKIDAEGHDLAILDSLDFTTLQPRLVMVEFGEHFSGQRRSDVTAAIARMNALGYGACVVCLRPANAFAEQDWRTQLYAITVDALPATDAGTQLMGNILFFPRHDAVFLPSLLAWLETLARDAQEPITAYGADANEMW